MSTDPNGATVSASPEAEIFGLAAFLVASARDTLEATPAYGAFRLLEAAARLARATDDAYLHAFAERISESNSLLLEDLEAYRRAVDALLVSIAEEVKARNMA
jgi:hypothetical protein